MVRFVLFGARLLHFFPNSASLEDLLLGFYDLAFEYKDFLSPPTCLDLRFGQ